MSTKSSWNQVWAHVSKQAVELQLSYKEVALKNALVSFLNCFGRKMLHLTSECVEKVCMAIQKPADN